MTPKTTAAPRRRNRLDTALIAIGALLVVALILTLVLGGFTFGGHRGSGSGVAAEQARSVPAFSGVVLAGANNVIIHVGAKQSVVVHADRNLLHRVTTQVRSHRLVIGTTPGNLNAKRPMFVTVGVPSLDALALEGAGNIAATGIDASRLTVELPGSGNIDASGTAARLVVTIGGQGTAQLRGLVARDATAALSGDGTIMVTATRSLTATLSGTGTILYGGEPQRLIKKLSGSGTISAG